MNSRAQILGIPIDALTREEALDALMELLNSGKQHHVMTPNAEMLVEAMRNPAFARVLRLSSLNVPDSQGVVWMGRFAGQHIPERVTGADTVEKLLLRLHSGIRVFFLGAKEGVAKRAAEEMKKKNPELNIVMTMSGSPRPEEAENILTAINAVQPHLLLVAYGAPIQDLWIDQHMHEMPSVRVAMGVGGTLDFLAGEKRRAPKILQRIGLEWMWRFAQEPGRYKRMWNAVVVFPFYVLLRKSAR